MVSISLQYAGHSVFDGRFGRHSPFLVIVEQRRDVFGQQNSSEPPPLDVRHVADQTKKIQRARRTRDETCLFVAEPLDLSGQDGTVVREISEQNRAFVFADQPSRPAAM